MSLTPDEIRIAVGEYVREKLKPFVRKKHGDVSDFARRLGLKSQTLTQFLDGSNVGPLTEPAFAEEFAGGSIDKLHADAVAWWNARPDKDKKRPLPKGPVTGKLPGWDEAEKEARQRFARLQIPDWAWARAREVTGAALPQNVTAETVKSAAMFVLEHGRPERS